jgi:hypothetical protein
MSSFVKQQLEYGTDNNLNPHISTSFFLFYCSILKMIMSFTGGSVWVWNLVSDIKGGA